jgi:hypothetical protein
MPEARPGRCSRQGRDDVRVKAGPMREARPGRCARQGGTVARGKAGQMREARHLGEASHIGKERQVI